MNSNKILKNLKSLTLKALTTIRSKNVLKKLRFYEILFEMNSQGIIRNKREIFYLDVPIFGKQEVVDSLIKETCKELKEIPCKLNITNTLKGIYFGKVEFVLRENDKIVFNPTQDPFDHDPFNTLPFQPRTILIPDMNQVHEVTTSANFCLVVEKDTIFSRILRSKSHFDHVPFLLVCGKGYPCRNTLLFLSKLKIKKVLGLFDYDPYGLDIFLKYKEVCPALELINLRIDLVPDEFQLELTERDKIRLKKLKINEHTKKYALEMEKKVELESVFDCYDVIKGILKENVRNE